MLKSLLPLALLRNFVVFPCGLIWLHRFYVLGKGRRAKGARES